MAPVTASPRVKRIQTVSLALMVTAGVVNYVDRATLAVANPLIRQDLGLTLADMGLLLSAFLWAYAFAQLPAGAISDRIGPRLMLTIGLSCWSLGQMLGGIVTSFWEFVGARIVLGIGEAPHFPTCARVSRDWFPGADPGRLGRRQGRREAQGGRVRRGAATPLAVDRAIRTAPAGDLARHGLGLAPDHGSGTGACGTGRGTGAVS